MKEYRIKTVIFDMDGLMFDTERIAAQAWQETAGQMGFEITEERLRQLRGRNVIGGRKLFRQWYGDRVSYDEGRRRRALYVNRYIEEHGTPVKDGLAVLLDFLETHGYRKALATSSGRDTAVWYFQKAGLEFSFDVSVCGGEAANGKPAPDIFLKAVEKLGLRPGECLVLEDSFNGVRAAAAAGCPVIMVPDLQEADEEIKGLCWKVLGSLKEVVDYL